MRIRAIEFAWAWDWRLAALGAACVTGCMFLKYGFGTFVGPPQFWMIAANATSLVLLMSLIVNNVAPRLARQCYPRVWL